MTQAYQLRNGVSMCSFDGCVIILDVHADRYWQLTGPLADILTDIAQGRPDHSGNHAIRRLVEMGLVVPADPKLPGSPALPAAPRAVKSSALSEQAPAGGSAIVSVLPVAWHLLRARIELKTRRLDAILCSIRRGHPVRTRNPADLTRLARRFSHSRRLLPFSALCLPDSLAFLRFAAARGHYPQLVFGVEAYPFSAHCWVQHDDAVLNDLPDHAALFRPILAV